MNTWQRKALTIMSVPLLAVPSAIGVYQFLEPTSGPYSAGMAAVGFELLYIGVNILMLSPALQSYARNVALAAVGTAILMNTLAHYGDTAVWDPRRAILSLIASAPLAALAYAVSVLLHKLSEEEHTASRRQHDNDTALSTMLHAPVTNTTPALTQVNVHVNPPVALIDTKASTVKSLVDGGMSITQAARQVGVSRQTASKYVSVKEE